MIELCKVKVRAHVGMFTKSFLSNRFYFSLMSGPMDFSDTAIFVANKTLSVLISLNN